MVHLNNIGLGKHYEANVTYLIWITISAGSIEKMRTEFSDTSKIAKAMEFILRHNMDNCSAADPADQDSFHFLDVARLLFEATDGRDTELVIAGLLHHVLETGWTTQVQLGKIFGVGISQLVAEVTGVSETDGSRPMFRRYGNVNHYSPRAKMLVIADSISNMNRIADKSRNCLDANAQHAYVDSVAPTLDQCNGAHLTLQKRFDEILRTRFA